MEELKFTENPESVSSTQIKTTTWSCSVTEKDVFLITRIKLQDLINIRLKRVNFIGWEKPKLGTLEEHIDVFTAAWLYLDLNGNQRMRPLMGAFNGGFEKLGEAEQMCRDVWRNRERYRTSLIKPA